MGTRTAAAASSAANASSWTRGTDGQDGGGAGVRELREDVPLRSCPELGTFRGGHARLRPDRALHRARGDRRRRRGAGRVQPRDLPDGEAQSPRDLRGHTRLQGELMARVTMSGKTSVAANAVVQNILTGQIYERLPRSEEHTSELQSLTNLV